MNLSLEKIQELQHQPAEKILSWALETFGDKVALSCSFQCEESVLIDMMHKICGSSSFRIFTLDTGRLNEETYLAMESLRTKYNLTIEAQFPDREAVEKLEREKGLYSFRESLENRKECCNIRKVIPLNRALSGLDGWITGLRSAQSVTRAELPKIEINIPRAPLIKINPLADWSAEQVWAYIKDHKVPYNALHDAAYPSIGCAPCTRAIEPGADIRSGRWWWENPDHKECGLHLKKK